MANMVAKIRRYFSYEQRAWRRYGDPYTVRLCNALEGQHLLSRIIIGQVVISSSQVAERLVCRDLDKNRLLEKSLLELTPHQVSDLINYLIWVQISVFSRSLRESVPQIGYNALVEDCVKVVPLTLTYKAIAQMIMAVPTIDIAQLSKRTFSDVMSIVGQDRPGLLKEIEWELLLGAVFITTRKEIECEIQELSKR
jgi:hypothetical protein